MIRKFHPDDLKAIQFNRFSDHNPLTDEDITSDHYYQNTVVDGSDVVCIIAFRRYWESNFVGGFMISDKFRAIHARELKKFLHNAMKDFNCQRFHTDSVAHPVLDRWHKFLGFTLEGTRRKLIFNQDFRMWALFPPEVRNGG